MREESHLDDMRSAIRGDFERLAERRGSQELMRSSESATDLPEPEEDSGEVEPVAAAEASEQLVDVEPEPIQQDVAREELPLVEEPPSTDEPDEPQHRSLLDRLLGR